MTGRYGDDLPVPPPPPRRARRTGRRPPPYDTPGTRPATPSAVNRLPPRLTPRAGVRAVMTTQAPQGSLPVGACGHSRPGIDRVTPGY
ncbi:hypothetical protein STTU_4698 [Streptomyces sp. Tu6071]|nr:hypothetical protein STTU_4698 [Streptomyces sp. Tu6071]